MRVLSSSPRSCFPVPLWLVAGLVLAAAVPTQAQTGLLFGTVSDSQGDPLDGATATILQSLTTAGKQSDRTVSTDQQGQFRARDLEPGSYELIVSREGCSTVVFPRVDIQAGRSTILEVTMDCEPEQVEWRPPFTVDPRTPLELAMGDGLVQDEVTIAALYEKPLGGNTLWFHDVSFPPLNVEEQGPLPTESDNVFGIAYAAIGLHPGDRRQQFLAATDDFYPAVWTRTLDETWRPVQWQREPEPGVYTGAAAAGYAGGAWFSFYDAVRQQIDVFQWTEDVPVLEFVRTIGNPLDLPRDVAWGGPAHALAADTVSVEHCVFFETFEGSRWVDCAPRFGVPNFVLELEGVPPPPADSFEHGFESDAIYLPVPNTYNWLVPRRDENKQVTLQYYTIELETGEVLRIPVGAYEGPDSIFGLDLTPSPDRMGASYFFNTGSLSHELKYGTSYRQFEQSSIFAHPAGNGTGPVGLATVTKSGSSNPRGATQYVATYPGNSLDIAISEPFSCLGNGVTACPNEFSVHVDWKDFQGNTGHGRVVPGGSADSSLFWFFKRANWEMLIKVLDACANNEHFWVFYAATTNVEFDVTVSHPALGSKRYNNPLGKLAPAVTDTTAFACTPAQVAAAKERLGSDPGALARDIRGLGDELSRLLPATSAPQAACVDSDTVLCLTPNRFRVEVEWKDFKGKTGVGRVTPLRSTDSGLFWFFSENNWELLIKILNGCPLNDHFWVLAAATTNVEYTLRVTDTVTDDVFEVFNALGKPAAGVIDVEALPGCG